jgi:hypothetical protein
MDKFAYADQTAPVVTLLALALVSVFFIIVWCWADRQPRAVRLVGTLLLLVLFLLIGATVVLTVPLYNS